MNRKEFLKVCGLLGLSIPLQGMISACSTGNDDPVVSGEFSGKVLIIGAGAAGMAAGYLLAQNGTEFEILEASGTHGGRMKHTTSFVDFPVPLGAEWLHTSTGEFTSIVNDSSVNIATQTVGYSSQDIIGYYENGNYTTFPQGDLGVDRKFVNSTWFDFFDTYVAPSVLSNTRFNTVVSTINYTGDKVIVTDNNGQTYEADKLIFTAPLKMLQLGTISFTPALPSNKQNAIQNATVWGGFKAFFEFSTNFYPTLLSFPDSETSTGQRLYYDASYGQNSNRHVLGLFSVGQQAEQYQNLDSGDALRDYMLNELDQVFNGAASASYVNHISQNWNEEPHIRAAYLADVNSSSTSTILSTPIDNKVFFAGEAYSSFSVHVASRAARDAVRAIVS
jgi:monoamine oxidase